jgi:hypothetical protein
VTIAFHPRAWLTTAALVATTATSPALAVSPALPPADDASPSLTGEALLRSCADPSANSCWTYVAGVSDGVLAASAPGAKPYCLPGELEAGDLVVAVRRYLVRHPEGRQRPAASIVLDALRSGYPCAGERKQG